MLTIHLTAPEAAVSVTPDLADLSRNASVISDSSSSSSDLHTPARPRPVRTFSSPRTHLSPRSRSPQSPTTPRSSRPPAYLTRELGFAEDPSPQPKSRSSSVNGRIGPADFEFGRVLGEGSYSTVFSAKHINTGNEYAIKVLDKNHLKRNNKLQTALAEKNTLVRLGAGHPGIVRLHWAFQDEWSLYFVLDLARNGELQSRISRLGSLSVDCSRYYTAQIVDALDYMHTKGVIHRDLKPENLLLDDAFRLKITDFGTGKIMDAGVQRAKTFVGTAQYVSPELLEVSETSRSSDFWALGCIIYQMIAGRFAFHGLSEFLTWQKIKSLQYEFPDGFDEEARDLVQKLLVRDPAKRLGAGIEGGPYDMAALRGHPFLSSIKWATLWTDPAPPLESGLWKKEARPLDSSQQDGMNAWEDLGAAWDDLVDGDDPDGDEISWASDGEGVGAGYRFGNPTRPPVGYLYDGEEVGPMGEQPLYLPSPAQGGGEPPGASPPEVSAPVPFPHSEIEQKGATVRFSVEEQKAEALAEEADVVPEMIDVPGVPKVAPIDVPLSNQLAKRSSYPSTGSGTSSSDGSPVETLEATLERGRKRGQTPIQGHGTVDPAWWSLILPEESIIFNTAVETSALKRRASRLLAMAVAPRAPRKIKSRVLILTTRRLVCVKLKEGQAAQLRIQLMLRPSARSLSKEKEKEREKEARSVMTGVEPKGEREFVVLTNTKTFGFTTTSSSLAATWIRKIREALATPLEETFEPSNTPTIPRT